MSLHFDLNIPTPIGLSEDKRKEILNTLGGLGYGAMAWNHVCHTSIPKEPCFITKVKSSPIKQYTRLTLCLKDPQQNYGINSGGTDKLVSSYDILAIQPESEKMFITACTSLDIDIISLPITSRLPFPLKSGYIKAALNRGVSFELCYAPLIEDSNSRRHSISNARTLLRLGGIGGSVKSCSKGKVFLSSGTTNPWFLRPPMDVKNLSKILGVPTALLPCILSKNPMYTFMHAATRKHSFRASISIVGDDVINANSNDDHHHHASKKAKTTDMESDFISFK